MTSPLFIKWVSNLDRRFQREDRKVCLLVDNCTVHPVVAGLKAVKLVFLPPNTTAKLQPCDQGIIQNLKKFYRSRMLERLLFVVNTQMNPEEGGPIDIKKHISLLDAVRMLRSAWMDVKPETVAKCFAKAGFVVGL